MWSECIAAAMAFLLLAALGFGPARLLTASHPRGRAVAAGLAPALGLALMASASLAVAYNIGPLATWTTLLTAGLAVFSAACWAFAARLRRVAEPDWRPSLALSSMALMVLAILLAPALLGGLPYVFYMCNPSDALLYISLADGLRQLGHDQFAAVSNSGDPAFLLAALQDSPTAMYTSRFLHLPVRLGTMAFMGWFAEIARLPTHRTHFVFMQLSLGAAAPAFATFAWLAGARLRHAMLAGAGIAIGIWGRLIVSLDASSQANALALTGLFCAGMALAVEASGVVPVFLAILLVTVAAAGIVNTYVEAAPLIGFGSALFLLLIWWTPSRNRVLSVGLAAAAATVIAVAALGLATLNIEALRYQLVQTAKGTYSGYGAETLVLIARHQLDVFAGGFLLASWTPAWLALPLAVLGNIAGLAMLALLLAGMVLCVTRPATAGQPLIPAMALSGGIVFMTLLARNNAYASQKALMFAMPFSLVALAIAASHLGRAALPTWAGFPSRLNGNIQARTAAALLVLSVGQSALMVPWAITGQDLPQRRDLARDGFDLATLQETLRARRPEHLAIFMPPADPQGFVLPYLVMSEFRDYRAAMLSGYIFDNNGHVPGYKPPGAPPRVAPDYLITTKGSELDRPELIEQVLVTAGPVLLYQVNRAAWRESHGG